MHTTFILALKTLRIFGYFVTLMLLYCVNLEAQERKNCCATIYKVDTLKSVSIIALSHEYRRLSNMQCDECFYWSSGLQQIMTELGERLEGKSKSTIRKVMGRPDKKNGNQWIYDWRNGHDYLFFEFTDGRAKANWYYAYE